MRYGYSNRDATIESVAHDIVLLPLERRVKKKEVFFFNDAGCGCCADSVRATREETLSILQTAKDLIDQEITRIKNESM